MTSVESGFDVVSSIMSELPLKGIIGLHASAADGVSGYFDGTEFCRDTGLEYIQVKDYSMKASVPELGGLDIDLLLVLGWQRLIPEWFLDKCRIGAIGNHGSAYGITGGRGRSPQNWALILGEPRFHLAIYWIESSADAGPVVSERSFDYTDYDDIRSSYKKCSLHLASMLIEANRLGKLQKKGGIVQDESKARYLPQRIPSDGEIDWTLPSRHIYNLVRALTKPYPGAFASCGKQRIIVWKGRLFEVGRTQTNSRSGEVTKIFMDKSFLVTTGDGSLIVDEYDGPTPEEGAALSSCNYGEKLRNIIKRHESKYPNRPLSSELLSYCSKFQ